VILEEVESRKFLMSVSRIKSRTSNGPACQLELLILRLRGEGTHEELHDLN